MARLFTLSGGIVALALLAQDARAQQFYGELLLKPDPDGIHMLVQRPFGFIDKQGRKWEVPPEYKSDGASIPRPLWTPVGSPFTGKYLPPAIIHDFYCDLKSRKWKDVHRVFYDAMIANGVGDVQAKLMYYAVYRFGPRWIVDEAFTCPPTVQCNNPDHVLTVIEWQVYRPVFGDKEFNNTLRRLTDTSTDLAVIEKLGDDAFYAGGKRFQINGRLKSYVKGEVLETKVNVNRELYTSDIYFLKGCSLSDISCWSHH